jgi:hypothetical protein
MLYQLKELNETNNSLGSKQNKNIYSPMKKVKNFFLIFPLIQQKNIISIQIIIS